MSNLPEINGLLVHLQECQEKLIVESEALHQVVTSDRYKSISAQVEAGKLELEAMTEGLTEQRTQFESLKDALKKLLKQLKITQVEGCIIKTRQRKEVNKERLFRVMEGDIDNFLVLASITQVALKEFAKSSPALEKELMDCIEPAGEEVSEIEIIRVPSNE